MKTIAHLFLTRVALFLGGAMALLWLAGCATSGSRARYMEEIEPGSLPHLAAYRYGTNLEIRYPFRGKDRYAIANWPEEPVGQVDYQYRYAVLSFEKEPRKTRRALTKRANRLALRTEKQWQVLVDGIFQGLMPAQAGHGVLMLVQSREIALYRDKNRLAHVVRLEDKQADIVIDHAYGQEDYNRAAINLLEKSVGRMDSGQNQFLFITGGDPAFVLIDIKERLIVFLSYPLESVAQLADWPGWFTFRAFNSLIIRGFVLTAIKNPVTLVGRGLWHIGSSGAAALDFGLVGDAGRRAPLNTGPGMDLAAWERQLDGMFEERRYKARVEFFIDGDKFYPALIKSIENAVRSVDMQVFIFGSDEYAVTIANVLKNRSKTIRERVLMDDLGTLFGGGEVPPSAVTPGFTPPVDIKAYLRKDSNVHVRVAADPWLTTDHRKCIIIDDKQAYLGGMNIGWFYRYDWHDMMVRLTGPIAGRLEKDFDEAWAHAGLLGDFAYTWVALFNSTHPHKNVVPDAIDVRPLRTATWHMEIYRAQLEAIKRARKYIYIENAYFADYAYLRELVRARQRGVDVRVILPSRNDSGIMQASNWLMANDMVRNGIRVYAYPEMTHVKAAIYDGWACLGSANMEKMSLRVSQELDIAFSDSATVDRLKEGLFEVDFKRSHEMTGEVPTNWMDMFIKAFAEQL